MNSKRDEIINLLKFSHQEQKRFIATLTDEERTATGAADAWSPKDVLAHVASSDLETRVHLDDPELDDGDGEDFNAFNARMWAKHKDSSWAEIKEMVDQAHEGLVETIGRMDEEELADTERYSWTGGRPVWRTITFSCFYHPLQHVAELWAKRADLARANTIQEDAAAMQLALSSDDVWQGTVIYNLGCHYALTCQKEKALEKVAQGLALSPNLKEWAAGDSDLASIQDDPAFKALLD